MTLIRSMASAAAIATLVATGATQTPDLYDMNTVRSVYLTFSQPNWWNDLLNNYSSQTEIKADMAVDGKTYKDVGVRFRGNTSYRRVSGPKKSFNIRLDSFVPGQDVYGYDHLNLNNGYHDPTFMREACLYMVCRKYMPCPKANWVKLYLNNQYWGIYINVQQPNSTMMKEWYRDGDGNRYRGFPTSGTFRNSALQWLGSTMPPYQQAYQFKKGDGTDLRDMIGVLNNTAIANLEAELPRIWSVDQGWWYIACLNAFLQTDSYIATGKDHSHYHDPYHGRFHMYPFDLNEGLGAEGSRSPSYSPYFNMTSSSRPAMSRPWRIAKWKARYIAHYRTVIRDSYSWAQFGADVTRFHTMIAADVAADTKKIYTTAQFQQNLTQQVTIGNQPIPGLKQLIDSRRAYFNTFADFQTAEPTLVNLQHSPANPKNTETVYITVAAGNATSVTMYQRAKGPFIEAPMFDDGQHGDGAANDGVYGAAIPAKVSGTFVDYYVSATTGAGVMKFLPSTAEFQAPRYFVAYPTGTSAIEISEFVAKNNTGIRDEAMQYEDWLELRNTSNQPVSVAGMYISDNPANSSKWKIPTGVSIPAFGTLLIWCDEDSMDGPLHANFKLSANGETILLFDTDGRTLVDTVVFGPQAADISTGRPLGYRNVWATYPAPTPRAANAANPCGHLAYDRLSPVASPVTLAGTALPQVGGTADYTISGAPASTAGVFAFGGAPFQADFGAVGSLLLNPAALVILPIATDGSGNASPIIPIPNAPALAGQIFYFQAFVSKGTAGGFSNGVSTRICP